MVSSNALVPVSVKPAGLVPADPQAAVSLSKVAASACRALLDHCIVTIPNKRGGPPAKHMKVEGWTMIASAHGLTAGCDKPERKEDKAGRFQGYEVRGWVRNQAGVEVSSAWGMVTVTEPRWNSRDEFQVSSMAQTRAVGKACRLALGHVVAFLNIPGLDACPAEEILDEVDEPAPKPAPLPAPTAPRPMVKKAEPVKAPEPAQVAKAPEIADNADPFIGDATPAAAESCTRAQWGEICRLVKTLHLKPESILAPYGAQKGSDLTYEQANSILLDLAERAGE
jgi:hypothetical protein